MQSCRQGAKDPLPLAWRVLKPARPRGSQKKLSTMHSNARAETVDSCKNSHKQGTTIEMEIAEMIHGLQSMDSSYDGEIACEMASSSFHDIHEENEECDEEESHLPPPKPYYNRHACAQPSMLQSSLVRVHSSGNLKSVGRSFLISKPMTQSMPNLQYSRSHHNRSIGRSLSASNPVSDPSNRWQSRSSAFEALMEQ